MGEPAPREYLLYLRKSRGRTGISRQRTITTTYIQRRGGIVAGEYADADRTAFQRVGGTRPERENFDRLLAGTRQRPGACIAAWHADRLVRNPGDTEALIEVCAAGGNLIETPSGGTYDLATASGRKRLRDDATDAAYEVDHAIERMTAQKAEAAGEGAWLGGPVPFGWRRQDGGLVLAPAEADAIAAATDAVLHGTSLRAVTRAWNAAGLRTRRCGNPWRPLEVRTVLLRARNAGLHVHRGVIQQGVTAQWPPIVTEGQFYALRAALSDPERRTSPGAERAWLLSGIAVCGICGQPMTATSTTGRGRVKRCVYRCRQPGKHVARDCVALDGYVTGWTWQHLRRAAAAGLMNAEPPDTRLLDAELKAARAQLADLGEEAGRRRISVQVLATAAAMVEKEIADLEGKVAALAQPGPLSVFGGSDPAEVWPGLDLSVQRAVVLALLERVVVNPAPLGRPAGWRPGQPYFGTDSVVLVRRDAAG